MGWEGLFFFNDTATTEIYTLALHDALPICEQQRERTREEFGSEYERAAQERGSEEEAERELRERRGRVERQVEPLSEESRGRYEQRWGEDERVFVDNPGRSIELADRTVLVRSEERRDGTGGR